jgi:hypothetical protein
MIHTDPAMCNAAGKKRKHDGDAESEVKQAEVDMADFA